MFWHVIHLGYVISVQLVSTGFREKSKAAARKVIKIGYTYLVPGEQLQPEISWAMIRSTINDLQHNQCLSMQPIISNKQLQPVSTYL